MTDLDMRIRAYIPLVRHIASRIRKTSSVRIETDDLFSVGLAAVHRALNAYDPERGAENTYVGQAARYAMWGYLRGSTNLPEDILKRVRASTEDDQETMELRAFMHFSPIAEDVQYVDPAPSSERMLMDRERGEGVRRLLDCLPEMEREIVLAHYYDEVPAETVTTSRGFSKGYASVLHTKALNRLRVLLERRAGL